MENLLKISEGLCFSNAHSRYNKDSSCYALKVPEVEQ